MSTLRADAAFTRPAIYEALEARGAGYAIRIPANRHLEPAFEDILLRSPGRASWGATPVAGTFAQERAIGCRIRPIFGSHIGNIGESLC
jgi:hypothetical protein